MPKKSPIRPTNLGSSALFVPKKIKTTSTMLITCSQSQNEVKLAYAITQKLPADDSRLMLILDKLYATYSQQFMDYKESLKSLHEYHALQNNVFKLRKQLYRWPNYNFMSSELECQLQNLTPRYNRLEKLIEETSYSLLQQLHPGLKAHWIMRHRMVLLDEKQSKIYIENLINTFPIQLEKTQFTDVIRATITQNKDLLPPERRRQQDVISYWVNKAALLCDIIELKIETDETTKQSQYTYSLLSTNHPTPS